MSAAVIALAGLVLVLVAAIILAAVGRDPVEGALYVGVGLIVTALAIGAIISVAAGGQGSVE